MDKQKVLVIIPAFNEENSIADVVYKARQNSEADIVVINDGSKDNTAKAAADAGAKVINLSFNLGIGGAMQTGYMFARDNNYDVAVQVDADGQHNPAFLKAVIEKVSIKGFDMAIGSRYFRETAYKSSAARRLGMIILSKTVQTLTGMSIKDTTSGFRAVNRNLIEYFAESYPTDYPEVDVLVKLYKRNCRVCEVPVEMERRKSGKSSITTFKSVYYMIKVSLALIINSLRTGEV